MKKNINSTDNKLFTTALHESAHFITGIYYSVQEGVRQEFEIITIIEDDNYEGFIKRKEGILSTDNLLKYLLAGYAIEFIQLPSKHRIEFMRKVLDEGIFNDRSDLYHCLEIIRIKLIDKVDYLNLTELIVGQLNDAVQDCKLLLQDINDVAKILFEKKTIKGKEIDELTNKYYLKYNQ